MVAIKPRRSDLNAIAQGNHRVLRALEELFAGTTTWGQILGSLSDQEDLQTALDAKQALGDYASAAQGAKADTASQPGHTHTRAEIVDFGEYLTDAPEDGLQYARQDGAWSPIASGASVYALWKAKGNLSSASFDDIENALSWGAFEINPGSDVTLSGSQITVGTAGTYKFTVTLRTDNGNRTELFIRTYIDTGAGLTQDADEIVSDYVARDADQDTGSVTLVTALTLASGDVVEFRGFGDTDGTCVGLDEGTILLIERAA